MRRRGAVDVAVAAAVAAAVAVLGAMVWHFPLRSLWGIAIEEFGHTTPVLVIGVSLIPLFHATWLALASFVATRTLDRPVDVWKRLYPVAIVVMIAAETGHAIERVHRGGEALHTAESDVTYWLLSTNVFYAFLWVFAWIHLRRLRAKTPDDAPPVWRRPGVWI